MADSPTSLNVTLPNPKSHSTPVATPYDQPQPRSLQAIRHPHARLSAQRTHPDVAVPRVVGHRKRGG